MGQKTQLTAHSGAEHTADNSLEFVRYALTLPVDAFEIDVQRNAQGKLALGHDEAGEHAPTLEEAFALTAAHPTMKINCDLKQSGLEKEVGELAQKAGLTGRLIFSGTVNAQTWATDEMLRQISEVYLNIEEYEPDLYENYRNIPDYELQAAAAIADVCKRYGVRTVNINHMLVTRRFVEALAQDGLRVSAWTVNEEKDMRWFFAQGVHNVTTREPIRAIALRDAKG